MFIALTPWPNLDRAIWTAVTLAVALGVGLLINAIVIRRLQKIAERTKGQWDDAVALELKKRIPLWSALVGIWVSIGFWPTHPADSIVPYRWVSLSTGILVGIAILSVTFAASAIATRLVSDFGPRSHPGTPVSGLMKNVVRLIIVIIGVLVLLKSAGVEITPMLAALGVGGLAVALALQDPMSNLFAGLFITVGGQIRIGDYVRMEGGPEGVISDFKWHATQLQTMAGNMVIVPNAKLAQAIVTNFERPTQEVGVGVEMTVAPDSDLAEVERIALTVAGSIGDVTGAVAGAEPSVRFQTFSDLGVRFTVSVRSKQFADQFLIRHELVKRLHAALRHAGIELPTLGGVTLGQRIEGRGQRAGTN